MMYLRSVIERWRHESDGAVAMMFGLSAIILMTIAGVAIDTSRVYNIKFKLGEALDAAALASAKLLDDENASDAMFQSVGESYVKAYMKRVSVDHVTWNNVRVVPDRTESSVTVSVDVAMSALFGAIASDFTTFTFTPTSKVIYKPKRIELSLVLDITGSMCDIAPGLPADACSSGAKIDALKSAAKDMVNNMAATDPAPEAIKIAIVPYAASVNAGAYAGLVSNGNSVDGCVVERNGGNAYTDAAAFGSEALGTSRLASNASYSCPTAAVLPLTDISNADGIDRIERTIDDLRGFGGTAGHLGTAWGWYMLSPSWGSIWPSESRPKPYDQDKVIKTIVIMTDGMFNTAYRNGGENYVWPDSATGDKTKPGSSSYQALKICENVRKLGGDVQIYTVGFQTPPEAEEILKECATEANFFNADSASQLIDAFKTIASKITIMRVSG